MRENLQTYPRYNSKCINFAETISCRIILSIFLSDLRNRGDKQLNSKLRITSEGEAERIKQMMNTPGDTFYILQGIQSQHYNWQRFDYIPSNLGKGYIFYFICDQCERRVEFLYMPEWSGRYLCRTCHNLRYPSKPRRKLKSFQ
jgi:formylmethanofuran dehydrogenase subunit E